ncbi:MAG: hypothetical protein LBN06_04425 [Prevotellaceae bacterium]|jgi:hypothetical protein|nr:hypothetical protein [Prevotellaceae bacterium]
MSEMKRCPICKRSKTKAIQEQTTQRVACGVNGCVFSKEIVNAIESKTKIKVVKQNKPKIKIEKAEKLKIKIVKN